MGAGGSGLVIVMLAAAQSPELGLRYWLRSDLAGVCVHCVMQRATCVIASCCALEKLEEK